MRAASARLANEVSARPTVAIEMRIEEARKRLHYWRQCFAMVRQVFPSGNGFNTSLHVVRKMAEGKSPVLNRERLHPEIEILINHHAMRRAADRDPTTAPDDEDLAVGLCHVADTLEMRRGRPKDAVLSYFVEALITLFEETLGQPVILRHYTNSVYDPDAPMGPGEAVISHVQTSDPSITRIAIIDAARAARARRKKSGASFLDLMPGYGWTVTPEGRIDTTCSSYRVDALW